MGLSNLKDSEKIREILFRDILKDKTKKVYVWDIDNTICNTNDLDYENCTPKMNVINFINRLYREGNYIKMFTARGSTTGIDWRELTEKQLKEWGVLYHELHLNKIAGDFYVDDKAINVADLDI